MTDRYLEPHQARIAAPSDFETSLGDTIEAAYAEGIHDLDGLVVRLEQVGPPAPDGNGWTTETFTTLMAELGR